MDFSSQKTNIAPRPSIWYTMCCCLSGDDWNFLFRLRHAYTPWWKWWVLYIYFDFIPFSREWQQQRISIEIFFIRLEKNREFLRPFLLLRPAEIGKSSIYFYTTRNNEFFWLPFGPLLCCCLYFMKTDVWKSIYSSSIYRHAAAPCTRRSSKKIREKRRWSAQTKNGRVVFFVKGFFPQSNQSPSERYMDAIRNFSLSYTIGSNSNGLGYFHVCIRVTTYM